MSEELKQSILSIIRNVLSAVGGYLTGKGMVSAEVVQQGIGVVMVVAPLIWGVWEKYQQERKMKEREAVAVNVGIAVADRTPGATPPVPVDKAPAVIEAFKPIVPEVSENSSTGLSITPDSPVVQGVKPV